VLGVVGEALAEVNAGLVSQLATAGIPARGLLDALEAVRHGDERLGLVGTVSAVDGVGVGALLAGGVVPVISPLAGGLNVNADHAAAAVATAIGASELVFLSDVPGVLDAEGRVIRSISAAQAPRLIDGGQVTGGMIPKLNAGTAALRQGVRRVWIGAGTVVTA
jgi:acetylglutamate kinase